MGMCRYVERSSGVFRDDEVGMKGPGVETLFSVSEGWSFSLHLIPLRLHSYLLHQHAFCQG